MIQVVKRWNRPFYSLYVLFSQFRLDDILQGPGLLLKLSYQKSNFELTLG